MNVRPAHVDDSSGIASIHMRGWQAAYRGIVPESYLESLSIERRTAFWRSQILESSSTEVVIAQVDNSLVGWAAFGLSRDGDVNAGVGELHAVYVAPETWRRGVGRALWGRVKERLHERGFKRVSVWVLRDNVSAVRFYEAVGFVRAGERSIEIGGKELPELRYEVPVG